MGGIVHLKTEGKLKSGLNHIQPLTTLHFHKAGVYQLRAIVSRMNKEAIAISDVGALHSTIAELTKPRIPSLRVLQVADAYDVWKHNGQKRHTDQYREPLPAPLPALSAGVTIGSSFFFARSLALPGHMYVNIYEFTDYSIITYSGNQAGNGIDTEKKTQRNQLQRQDHFIISILITEPNWILIHARSTTWCNNERRSTLKTLEDATMRIRSGFKMWERKSHGNIIHSYTQRQTIIDNRRSLKERWTRWTQFAMRTYA